MKTIEDNNKMNKEETLRYYLHGWMDIGTAPKDGTEILLLDPEHEIKVTSDWWHVYANNDGHWENAEVLEDYKPAYWQYLNIEERPNSEIVELYEELIALRKRNKYYRKALEEISRLDRFNHAVMIARDTVGIQPRKEGE